MGAQELVDWLRPSPAEEASRAETLARLRRIVCAGGADTLTVVGSSAHGLVLPGGDLDVVLETARPLRQLGKELRRIGKSLVVLESARVPIIK